MIALLASSSDWHDHGWFWLWPLVPLFWLLVFFLLARLFFRGGRRGPWGGPPRPDAQAILAERYARGEIGLDEYRERLGNLGG
ncbi:MAG TPA: SHOCT domain-containing protein [Gaiellaceae bacterium]|nr:SHOCT domain-containing protein [Gaiellaceae bacterium]